MSIRSIQFNQMRIDDVKQAGDTVELRFDYAIIIKNMDAAIEDSRWYGAGTIRIDELASDDFELPALPATLVGADVCDNQMIYRDEVAIPFDFHGHVGLKLKFANSGKPVTIFGENLSLELQGHEKYIEHIKAE